MLALGNNLWRAEAQSLETRDFTRLSCMEAVSTLAFIVLELVYVFCMGGMMDGSKRVANSANRSVRRALHRTQREREKQRANQLLIDPIYC